MQRMNLIGIGAIALLSTVPFTGVMPGLASSQSSEPVFAQSSQQQAPIQLKLVAERQSVVAIASGQVAWKPLPTNASLLPGESIRYVVTASNISDRQIKNLVVTQPIPKSSIYVLGSATLPTLQGAKVDYSIDGGKTYSDNPTIRVKLDNGEIVNRPAPDSMYTNVRWRFGDSFPAKTITYATYQVRVR